MNATKTAKNAAKIIREPLETLKDQLGPIGEDAKDQIMGFFPETLIGKRQHEMASADLKRAREEQKLKEMKEESDNHSEQEAQSVAAAIRAIQEEYRTQSSRTEEQIQQDLKAEIVALQQEIAELSKIVGKPTTAHMEAIPKKVGAIDVKRLTTIVKTWRIEAKKSKDAQDMVAQRQNSKPATGMLAWVSGKQMKIHEQGTMQLQG